jgi:hypothetical protein
LLGSRGILTHEREECGQYQHGVTLVVTDEPPDRPEWITATLRLVAEATGHGRARLLERVAATSDADLTAGAEDDWGVGQIAVHLLLIERGVAGIALSLASGEPAGRTGQPRPAAAAVSRDGILTLAVKAEQAIERLRHRFPTTPVLTAVARHPYYGDLNTFGWLLTLPNHYRAHLEALDLGTASAL